eukprot:9501871-Pyramimonas_sp.AAC.1
MEQTCSKSSLKTATPEPALFNSGMSRLVWDPSKNKCPEISVLVEAEPTQDTGIGDSLAGGGSLSPGCGNRALV